DNLILLSIVKATLSSQQSHIVKSISLTLSGQKVSHCQITILTLSRSSQQVSH
ncbi:984_t:CDS:1, partial [Racocetra persica]